APGATSPVAATPPGWGPGHRRPDGTVSARWVDLGPTTGRRGRIRQHMIATRPDRVSASPASPPPRRPPGWRYLPGYLLFVLAGLVVEIGWVMVWTLSYHLTHGNDFTYDYLVDYDVVWRRLYDLLVLADQIVPNIEPPQTLDILVNSLMVAFIVVSVGYLAAVILVDRGAVPLRGLIWLVLGFGAI